MLCPAGAAVVELALETHGSQPMPIFTIASRSPGEPISSTMSSNVNTGACCLRASNENRSFHSFWRVAAKPGSLRMGSSSSFGIMLK